LWGCTSSSRLQIPDLSTTTPRQIQSKVESNFDRLNTFQGQARLIIEFAGSGYDGYALVYLIRPDSLFVKTEAILGIDVGALFLDHRYFAAYAPRENVLYYGEREILRLHDFLDVEIETDELYEALTGMVQVEVNATSQLKYDGNQILLLTAHEGGLNKYWISPKHYLVTRSEHYDETGNVVLRKELTRVRKNNGLVLPQTIKVTRPGDRERITVVYRKQTLNRKIDASAFKMKTAKNADKVYWGDLRQPRLDRESQKRSN
jgi:hypothetical protein